MKILERNLKKSYVRVAPESMDDLWHLYNVILKGDHVYARTTREIRPEGKYARPDRGQRVPVFLGVKVEEVGWDKLLGRLRIHGTICEAPETVPVGAHHSLNIALNTTATIVKKEWTKHHLDRLERASRASEKPMIILSIDDECYSIATTAQYGVEERIGGRVKLPGKLETSKRNAAVKEYFRGTLDDLRRIWEASDSPIVIIGVGFIKNDFAKFVQNEAKDLARSVIDVKGVNNGGMAGVHEALRSGVLLTATRRLRTAEETQVVEEILRRLGKDELTVTYGLENVKIALNLNAIEKFVLADSMLRESPDEKRLSIEDTLREVEQRGGEIFVVSTEHEAGAKLVALSGAAALLRFPIPQCSQ